MEQGDIVWGNSFAFGSPTIGRLPATMSISVTPTLIQQKSITGLVRYECQGAATRTISLNGSITREALKTQMAELRALESLVDTGYSAPLALGQYNFGTYIATAFQMNIVQIGGGEPLTIQWSLSLAECADESTEPTPEAEAIDFSGDDPINFEV